MRMHLNTLKDEGPYLRKLFWSVHASLMMTLLALGTAGGASVSRQDNVPPSPTSWIDSAAITESESPGVSPLPAGGLTLSPETGCIALSTAADPFIGCERNAASEFHTAAAALPAVPYERTRVPEPPGMIAMLVGLSSFAGLIMRKKK